MGLNGGLQYACGLAANLGTVWKGEGSERLLDLYDLQCRTVATKFVQRQTIDNDGNLDACDPVRRTELLEAMRRRARDLPHYEAAIPSEVMRTVERFVAGLEPVTVF